MSTVDLDNWQWRNPLPQGNPLDAIAFGNGTFVAVSRASTILTSPDGVTWTLRNSGVDAGLCGVNYVNNAFVAVGNNGTILFSPEGVTWTPKGSGTPCWLAGVAYGNSLFVAVGSCGAIMTSADGNTWSAPDVSVFWRPDLSFFGVTFGNGLFIAVDKQGTIVTSPDGNIWTERHSPGTGEALRAVAYGNGTFVAVGNSGKVLSSPDGMTWTERNVRTDISFTDVNFANGVFMAVGRCAVTGGGQPTIWTSSNGTLWAERTSGIPQANCQILFGSAHGNGTFVTVGIDGAILTSPDGVTWTRRDRAASPMSPHFSGVAYGLGRFAFVGTRTGEFGIPRGRVLVTSADLVTWARPSLLRDEPLYGITFANNMFVAVGLGPDGVLTSPDGTLWTGARVGNALHTVICGGGTFVAAGLHGEIVTSSDGVTWTKRSSGTDAWLTGVAFGNQKFVVVGDNGTILTSSDGGVTWTRMSCPITNQLRGVTYGSGTFVAVGLGHRAAGDYYCPVLTSTDGVTWAQQGTQADCYGLAYEDGAFVALGSDGHMMTSPDGGTWTVRHCGTSNNLLDTACGNGSVVVVGGAGTILQASASSGPSPAPKYRHSVAEARSRLSELIKRALEGERVVITRDGRPVVALQPLTPPHQPNPPRPIAEADPDWHALRQGRSEE